MEKVILGDEQMTSSLATYVILTCNTSTRVTILFVCMKLTVVILHEDLLISIDTLIKMIYDGLNMYQKLVESLQSHWSNI